MAQQMNKYAKAYMDNYLAQALAARANPTNQLAQMPQESLTRGSMPQESMPMQDMSQGSMPQEYVAQRGIGVPPQDAVDLSAAMEHANAGMYAGGDNAPLAVALSGIVGALSSHSKSKAEKEKKEYLAKALSSGDPYAIAAAGHPELAKVLLDQQARQQAGQQEMQFKMSQGDIDWERELQKLALQEDRDNRKAEREHAFTHGENELNRQTKQDELAQRLLAAKEDKVAKQEEKKMKKFEALEKVVSPENLLFLLNNPDAINFVVNNVDGNKIDKQFPGTIDHRAYNEHKKAQAQELKKAELAKKIEADMNSEEIQKNIVQAAQGANRY